MLCVCLTGKTLKENYTLVQKYRDKADLFELRYDLLETDDLITNIKKITETPVIFTIRLPEDGGESSYTKDEFLKLYEAAVECGYSYIDLHVPDTGRNLLSENDLKEVILKARAAGVTIIRSLHYMKTQPADLADAFRKVLEAEGDIPKLAVKPGNLYDTLSLFKLADSFSKQNKIIIGMGEYGFPTRILTARLGSLWTYTSPQKKKNAAPGHISPELLEEEYLYSKIKENDNILCVIGNPIMHSKSPAIHNPALRRLDLPFVYVPITVDRIEDFMALAEYLQIRGVSVTVPYKERVSVYCSSISESVKETGACNTLVRTPKGWEGFNTDIDGFLIPFKEFMGKSLEGIRVTVIGAGGGAKGIIYGLKKEGARILILNRTIDKAKKLAEEFNCEYAPLKEESNSMIHRYGEAIVQTTNCGMEQFEDIDPLSFYSFTGNEKVFDIVYNPPETLLMRRAKHAGCEVRNGERMLLEQAKVQFALYTSKEFI